MNNQAENPYVGTRTFSEEDAPRYFGRERESRDLLALVAFEQVVLFYAQSGTGKSSLINTRLIPGLEADGRFEVLTPSRVSGEIPPNAAIENVYVYSLMQNLAGHTLKPEVIGGMRIRDFLPKLARDTSSEKRSFVFADGEAETQKPRRRVLIIDQFEELFTTHPEEWESRGAFFEQLAEALEADPNLWVVLVMREDNIAYLDPYAHLMPDGLRVRYYMQKMDFEDALKAVKNPAENAGRPFNEGVAEQLVNDLRGRQFRKRGGKTQPVRGQYVEPIVLQAVCSTLWEELDTEGKAITTADLKKLGNVNKALGKYYEKRVHEAAGMDEVKSLGIRESEIRNWIGTQLITAEGRRNIVVRKAGGKSGGLEDSVVQLFSKKKDLIWEEGHGAASIYELTHDRLAKPILENNREWEKEHGFPFQSQVILWSEAKGKGREVHLLSEQALAEAERWILQNPDQLSNLESEFLDACRSKVQDEEDQRARELQQRERELQQQRLEDAQKLATEQTRSAQQARRLTRIAFSFVALAAIALVAAGWQWRIANTKNNDLQAAQILLEEEREKQQSLVDAYVATTLLNTATGVEFDQSLLLSVQAYKISEETATVQQTLFRNFQKIQSLQRFFLPPESSVPPEDSTGNLKISPDGGFVAVWGDAELTIWNQITGISEALPITGIKNLYFTPDSKMLVVVDRAGIRRWNLSENPIRALPGGPINFHPGSTTGLFAGDSASFFVSQGEDGSVYRWDAITSKSERIELPNDNKVTFSPSGESLVGLDENNHISLQSIRENGRVLGTFDGGLPTFSPDESLLAFANNDQSIISVTEVADQAVPFNIPSTLNGDITSMVFSNAGSYLAASDGSETEVWDIGSQRKIGESLDGLPVAFSPNENLLVVRAYDDQTGALERRFYCLPSIRRMEDPPEGSFIGFSHDGKTMAAESSDGFYLLMISGNCEWSPAASPAFQAESILLSPAAEVLASLELDGSILIRNVIDGTPLGDPIYQPNIKESSDFEGGANFGRLRFSPGGSILAYEVNNNELHLWEMNNNRKEIPIDEEESVSDPITVWALTEDVLLVGRESGTITKWELPSGSRSDFAGNAHSKIDRVIFNEENNNEALSISDNSIFLMDLTSGAARTEAMTGTYLDVNWESRLLATAANEDEIEIWDLNTGTPRNDNDPIEGIAIHFTPDRAHFLVTDGSGFSFYEASTLEHLGDYPAEDRESPDESPDLAALVMNPEGYDLKWSPNGKRFALASLDSLVQIYEVNAANPGSAIKFLGYSRYGYGGFMAFSEDSNYFFFNEGGCWIDVLNLRDNPSRWSTDKCTSGSFPLYLDGTKFVLGINDEEDPTLPPTTVLIYDMTAYLPGTNPKQLGSTNIDLGGQVDMRSYSLGEGGVKLVTLGVDGALYLWDLEKEPEVIGGVFGDAKTPVYSAAISPHGDKQALFIGNGIALSNPSDGFLPAERFNDHVLGINNIIFSREGSRFAALGDRDTTIFYDSAGVREGEPVDGVFEPADESGYFWKTTLAGETSSILWNSATGKKVADLSQGDNVHASPDGNYLAIRSIQNNITVLDANKDSNENKIGSDILRGEDITFNNFDGSVFLSIIPVAGDEADVAASQIWRISSDGSSLESVDIPGNFLGFTSGGRYVAMREADGKIRVWDFETGTSVDEFSSPFLRFSPTADLVVYQEQNQIVLKKIAGDDSVGRADGDAAEFSRDGSIVIIYDGTADQSTLLSADTGKPIGKFNGQIDILEDGSENAPYVYFSSDDNGFHLLSLTEGPIDMNPISADEIFRSSNGKHLISISFDDSGETINLWDGLTGDAAGEGSDLSDWAGFSEDGNTLILRHSDESITLLDAADPTLTIAEIDADRVLLVGKNEYAIAINEDDGRITLWDINARAPGGNITTDMDTSSIKDAVLSPDAESRTLALFGAQGIVLWDVEENEQIDVLKERAGTVIKMSFSANNKYLASLGRDGIVIWDISHQPPTNERFIPGGMLDMSFNEAEDHITYLSQDFEIYDVEINSGAGMDTPLASPILNPARVCRYDLSDDGTRAAFLVSNRVILWDRRVVEAGIPEPITQTVNSDCDYSAIVFSPDGSTLAILDGSQIHLWNAETGELSGRIKLGDDLVFPPQPLVPIAFIDAQTMAVEALDESQGSTTLSLWDLESMSEKFTIEGNLKGLAPNGSILLIRDKKERVILQDQSSEDLTRFRIMSEVLCDVAGRNFTRDEWVRFLGNVTPYPDSAENATCPQWEIEPAPVTGN